MLESLGGTCRRLLRLVAGRRAGCTLILRRLRRFHFGGVFLGAALTTGAGPLLGRSAATALAVLALRVLQHLLDERRHGTWNLHFQRDDPLCSCKTTMRARKGFKTFSTTVLIKIHVASMLQYVTIFTPTEHHNISFPYHMTVTGPSP